VQHGSYSNEGSMGMNQIAHLQIKGTNSSMRDVKTEAEEKKKPGYGE